jgi:hypothetical protein
MPKICEFYGVVIHTYHNEHAPPHFHAEHGGRVASIAFDGTILRGGLHPRALLMIRRWANLHSMELRENWDRARRHDSLVRIAPLE